MKFIETMDDLREVVNYYGGVFPATCKAVLFCTIIYLALLAMIWLLGV